MALTREAILDKTAYGLTVYAYILRQHYPGETVLSQSGRDCKPTKNPFNENKETLEVKIVDGIARHKDLENWEFQGDVFDFAELSFKLEGQKLLEKINEVMHLRLDKEYSFYKPQKLSETNLEKVRKIIAAPMVSYFQNPVRNVIPSKEMSLVQVYNKIKSIAYKKQTETLRAFADSREAKKYKAEQFSYVTFSGTFAKRQDSELKKHSGLLTVDFDHLEDVNALKQQLLNDEYFETQMLFVSPSGDGLKWVIPIDLTQGTHQEYFQAIFNYVKITYGVEIDKSGKDVSRACFLPHDADVFINPKYL